MSWDVLLMRFPDDAVSVDDLTDDDPPPPIGPAAEVLDRIRAAFPGVDLSDPTWGILQDEQDGWSMESGIGARDPVESIMLHIRGGGDPVTTARRLARLLDCRALDCSDGEFLSDEVGGESWEDFQAYRDRVVGRPGE
ncbi:hypothetical protein [Nocardiopsis sp. CC223A]|uniref:hypothetical protein n=1 Tax=Nocardiopsis sp. CC223A TaxID=3044051 RepID=UPI00278BDCE3|nr:hypothetical protein [Nocardiopsis sp. CC223A]